MALGAFQGIAADVEGNAIEDATITVREGGGGALVDIFADRDGTLPLMNPWPDATDEGGYFRFFVEPGRYDVTATDGSGDIRTYEHVVILAEAVTGGGGGGDGVPSVDRMIDLVGLDTTGLSTGDAVAVTRYHTFGPARGGGLFRWAPGGNKSTADGGLVIDPTTLGGWDGTGPNLEDFLNAQGTGSGTGVWVRIQSGSPNAFWWGARGADDAVDLAATNKALAVLGSSRALWMMDGDFGRGSPALYSAGAYPGALAGHIMVGTEASPSDDSQPVLRITKWSNANRDTDSGLWEQGPVYFETYSTTGDAFTVGGTAIANARGDSAGDHVGWHCRGIARSPNANVFGLWSMVENRTGPVAAEIMAAELNVQTQIDAGWASSAVSGGGARGMVVLLVAGSEAGTVGVTIGKQTTSNGAWWTGLLMRANGTQPNTAGGDATVLGNGEQIRMQGAAASGDRYAGIRFQGGHFNYALSTVEAGSFQNDTAILLKPGHNLRWGNAPSDPTVGGALRSSTSGQQLDIAGFSLNFLSASRAILWQGGNGGRIQSFATSNPGRIEFDNDLGGSITFRTADGTAVLRIRSEDMTNPILQRIAGVNKAISVGAPDSGGAGFRMLRVSNAGH